MTIGNKIFLVFFYHIQGFMWLILAIYDGYGFLDCGHMDKGLKSCFKLRISELYSQAKNCVAMVPVTIYRSFSAQSKRSAHHMAQLRGPMGD